MQGNRSKDTKPELAVRRILHASGLRYRVHVCPEPSLRRTADIVFPRQRVAVFIDGCFWHGCEAHGGRQTKANPEYWASKRARNAARDVDTTRSLTVAGWQVLRFWEHEAPQDVASQITEIVRASTGGAADH
jgi:DNA mismatch endonuclease (patch repair protein)